MACRVWHSSDLMSPVDVGGLHEQWPTAPAPHRSSFPLILEIRKWMAIKRNNNIFVFNYHITLIWSLKKKCFFHNLLFQGGAGQGDANAGEGDRGEAAPVCHPEDHQLWGFSGQTLLWMHPDRRTWSEKSHARTHIHTHTYTDRHTTNAGHFRNTKSCYGHRGPLIQVVLARGAGSYSLWVDNNGCYLSGEQLGQASSDLINFRSRQSPFCLTWLLRVGLIRPSVWLENQYWMWSWWQWKDSYQSVDDWSQNSFMFKKVFICHLTGKNTDIPWISSFFKTAEEARDPFKFQKSFLGRWARRWSGLGEGRGPG